MGIMDALGGKKKPSEGPGIDVEIGEAAKQSRINKQALKEPEPEKPVLGKPSPMKPAKGPYGSQPGEQSPAEFNKKYPDLPKMHKGGVVKKTGPHVLLKGEAVLNKKDAKKVSALGGQPDTESVGSPDGMSIDKLTDGSFHIQHRSNSPEKETAPSQPKKFSARNVKHLVRHVRQAFGGGAQAEPDGDE